MTDAPIRILIAFCAGAFIGIVNYGGLWITLNRLPSSRHPVRLGMMSFLVRIAGATLLLALATGLRPFLVAACLCGLFIMRQILIRRLAPAAAVGRKKAGGACR